MINRLMTYGALAFLTAFTISGCGGSSSETTGATTTTSTTDSSTDSSSSSSSSEPVTAPAIQSVSGNDNAVTVTWTAVDGANSYIIYFSESSGVSPDNYDGKVETEGEAVSARANAATAEGTLSHTITGLGASEYYFAMTSVDSGGVESEASDEHSVSMACIESHDSYGTVAWSYMDCSTTHSFFINESTIGLNGEVLGTRAVNKGRVSFRMTNVDASEFTSHNTTLAMFFAYGNGTNNANWHWNTYYNAGGRVQSRFKSQRADERYGDGSRCPHYKCEEKAVNDSVQWQNNKTYLWRCGWDTTKNNNLGEAWCEIYEDGSSEYIARESVLTNGGYNSLVYFKTGGDIYGHHISVTVSDIRFTLFE